MIHLGVVMDPIGSINTKKDSTFAMLLEAQARGWAIHYMEVGDLYVEAGESFAITRELSVFDKSPQWYRFGAQAVRALTQMDIILMRKDPPFNMDYVYATYILELAQDRGTLVVNRADALRDTNEKLSIMRFAQCTAPSLVSSQHQRLRDFLQQHAEIVVKPLDSMGGASIFRVKHGDLNTNVILETLTQGQRRYVMAQKFIPEIDQGDKRILLIDGEPVPYALARIPAQGEARGNLAAGGTGVGVALSERDRWICSQLAPYLKSNGLLFVGVDVIGDYLTEINVTSPTCIRELDALYGLNISAQLLDMLENKLNAARRSPAQ